jgi:hypothetical protein
VAADEVYGVDGVKRTCMRLESFVGRFGRLRRGLGVLIFKMANGKTRMLRTENTATATSGNVIARSERFLMCRQTRLWSASGFRFSAWRPEFGPMPAEKAIQRTSLGRNEK